MAKKGSLKAIVKKAEPAYDSGTIIHLLESNKSHQPFVLVEADWDYRFYRRMLKGSQVNLGKAEEKEKSGCHYVEKIVQCVRTQKPHAKIIGIRDRDYTRYEPNYTKPQNIYLTDEHSLESMLFHSPNVRNALENKWNGFSAGFIHVLQDARHIAQYYVFSSLETLNVDFNDEKLRLNDFVDSSNSCMQVDWKDQLRSRFFSLAACQGKNEPDMHRKVSGSNFNNANDYEVCRGHDLLDTSYNTIHHGSLIPDDIMDVMVKAYTPEDFANTNLCKELNKWAKSENVKLMA